MNLEALWPSLAQESRDWLIAHNGEVLTSAVVADFARVNGSAPSDAWSGIEKGSHGFHLSDAGVDWIESVANGESPQAPLDR